MARPLKLVGAASSAGAYAPGQEKAPAAFRAHGLLEALISRGATVSDAGDVVRFRWRPDPHRRTAMNAPAVRDAGQVVGTAVGEALARDEDVLVLGGDCTVELGVVAGALAGPGRVGLVYVDFDTDLNTPETSEGALDWTGVAHLLDLPGSAEELSTLGPRRPMLTPDQVLFFGVGNISEPEAATVAELGLPVISCGDVARDLEAAIARATDWARGFDRVLVHFDVDALDFVAFPIAENVRRCQAMTLEAAEQVLAAIVALPQWRALTVTEVNPDHAPNEAQSFRQLNAMLARIMAGRPTPGKSQLRP